MSRYCCGCFPNHRLQLSRWLYVYYYGTGIGSILLLKASNSHPLASFIASIAFNFSNMRCRVRGQDCSSVCFYIISCLICLLKQQFCYRKRDLFARFLLSCPFSISLICLFKHHFCNRKRDLFARFLFSCPLFILNFSRYSFFLSSDYITNSPFVSRLFLSNFFMFHVYPFLLLSYLYLTNSTFVFVYLVTVLFYFHSSFFTFIPDDRLFNI